MTAGGNVLTSLHQWLELRVIKTRWLNRGSIGLGIPNFRVRYRSSLIQHLSRAVWPICTVQWIEPELMVVVARHSISMERASLVLKRWQAPAAWLIPSLSHSDRFVSLCHKVLSWSNTVNAGQPNSSTAFCCGYEMRRFGGTWLTAIGLKRQTEISAIHQVGAEWAGLNQSNWYLHCKARAKLVRAHAAGWGTRWGIIMVKAAVFTIKMMLYTPILIKNTDNESYQ